MEPAAVDIPAADELPRLNSLMIASDLLSIPLDLVFVHVLGRVAGMQSPAIPIGPAMPTAM